MFAILCVGNHLCNFIGSNSIAGETALDRLATALGGKAVLPHIVKLIPSMLVAREYRHTQTHTDTHTQTHTHACMHARMHARTHARTHTHTHTHTHTRTHTYAVHTCHNNPHMACSVLFSCSCVLLVFLCVCIEQLNGREGILL